VACSKLIKIMGNATSTAEKLEELINKHVYNVHAIGYNDVIGLNECVFQLNHTQFYQIKSTSLIVAQKLFMKREENTKMDIINENFRFLNKTIPLSTHPFFLLSISITIHEKVRQGDALPVLSRQHLHSTLEERIGGGIAVGYQQKINLALQIFTCCAVLHDLG
jgi:hypothetical protein